MKKYIVKYTVLIWLLIGATSCEEWLDINQDPNNPTSAPIQSLLVRSVFETADNVQNASSITSFYVQYLASPNPESATDVHESIPYDQTWFELYDVMTDLSDLEIQAEELGATNFVGIAKILKVINLNLVVDMWGDVPYSEAFFAQTLTPAYDDDQALYTTMQSMLDEAITALQSGDSPVSLGENDLIFGGDEAAWLKTAYALKARLSLHTGDLGDVLTDINSAYDSNADDAQLVYFETENNPWANVAINNAALLLGGWISEQLVEAMDGTTFGVVDPRMPFMFGTTDDGEYIGTENGAGRGDAAEQGERSTLVTGTFYSSEYSPLMLITYAEQKFIEAEAALGTNANQAYEAYLEGIRAHMDKIGVDGTDIDAYLAEPTVSVGANSLTLDLIMKEKYVAMFLHPETWADARRYDYQYSDMTLPANHNPEISGQFVRRLIYPESETQRNGVNAPSVSITDRIFWDQ